MTSKTTPFTFASRNDIEVTLNLIDGTIPNDLSGYVLVNSPAGTVNNETPIPEYRPDGSYNPEYGQMIFNGDGMVFRFGMETPGQISVKSKLLKTPCYFADEASKYGTDYYNQGLRFDSQGMARTSLSLGSRNQINTSVNAFKFAKDKSTRVTVNFDAGRPFEIDPKSLELITPIGRNAEWAQEMSPILENTFPLFQSSAHPSFDPVSKEFFTVCFQKNFDNLILNDYFPEQLLQAETYLKAKLQTAFEQVFSKLKLSALHTVHVLKDFIFHTHKQLNDIALPDYHIDQALDAVNQFKDMMGMENATFLMRWMGTDPLDRWNLVDEQGNNIEIRQTMHQTALSQDYIILVDSSLKFALDVLENVPFPKYPWLNTALRWITARTIEPTTPLYIIKRSDLTAGNTNVVAKEVIIPLETVHYSVLYTNPNNQITVFTSHNSALCAAEWVRPYDSLAVDPMEPIDPNTIGLFTCGEMDLGRVGKFILDGETGAIIDQTVIYDKGFDGDDAKHITRAHTWAVGLNTFRDLLSADNPNVAIPYIFWQFYGLDRRMLTLFIKELYEQYQNRLIPVEDMLNYTNQGVPFCLSRMNTASMQFDDFYLFKMNENLRSLQFVPRRADSPNQHPEAALNGYILCTMVNGSEDFQGDDYTREIWLFDAAKLAQGPIAKLSHPDLQYAFTIHSIWIPDAEPSPADYQVDIVADYTQVVNSFFDTQKQNTMMAFLNDTVFPHYQK